MERYFVIFEGRVQGVGFRWKLQSIATKYNVTGWVRNCYNGNVEAQLQGNHNAIMSVIQEINAMDRFISIDDYYMKPIPVEEREHGFNVNY